MIIKWNWLIDIIIKINGFTLTAITIFPFTFISDKADKKDLNHEKIHIRQQLETLIIFFYLIYGVHYLILRFKYKHKETYKKICFEKEAYANERNLEYLKDNVLKGKTLYLDSNVLFALMLKSHSLNVFLESLLTASINDLGVKIKVHEQTIE